MTKSVLRTDLNYSQVLEDFEFWPDPWKIVTFSKFKFGAESQPAASEEKFWFVKNQDIKAQRQSNYSRLIVQS